MQCVPRSAAAHLVLFLVLTVVTCVEKDVVKLWLIDVLLAAKMLYHLDPSTQGKCVTMATNLSSDLDQCTVVVMFQSLLCASLEI